jgi:hypothetical protein
MTGWDIPRFWDGGSPTDMAAGNIREKRSQSHFGPENVLVLTIGKLRTIGISVQGDI